MTTKEQITEVINDLIKTAKTLDHSTAAEVKKQIYTSADALQGITANFATRPKTDAINQVNAAIENLHKIQREAETEPDYTIAKIMGVAVDLEKLRESIYKDMQHATASPVFAELAKLSDALTLVRETGSDAVGQTAYAIRERIDKLLHTYHVEPHSPALDEVAAALEANNEALEANNEALEANNEALAAHNVRMEEVLTRLEKHATAATSDGDNPPTTNADKAMLIFNRICALKAEKAKLCEQMGAKWVSSTCADEYNNTIYALLEEIERLAGADAENE